MSWRSHWTSVDNMSVLTMSADKVPGVVDEVEDADVLVLEDMGNQEAWVLEGDVDDWEQLASLILVRCRFYRREQERSVRCPYCGARPGYPCTQYGGPNAMERVHKTRLKLLRKMGA